MVTPLAAFFIKHIHAAHILYPQTHSKTSIHIERRCVVSVERVCVVAPDTRLQIRSYACSQIEIELLPWRPVAGGFTSRIPYSCCGRSLFKVLTGTYVQHVRSHKHIPYTLISHWQKGIRSRPTDPVAGPSFLARLETVQSSPRPTDRLSIPSFPFSQCPRFA